MKEITHFILQPTQNQLLVQTSTTSWPLSYEYLRVFSPRQQQTKPALIAHQKLVQLNRIESVGKHGYRFYFNDNHQAIFSYEYLANLAENQETNWQAYLAAIKAQGLSREARII